MKSEVLFSNQEVIADPEADQESSVQRGTVGKGSGEKPRHQMSAPVLHTHAHTHVHTFVCIHANTYTHMSTLLYASYTYF